MPVRAQRVLADVFAVLLVGGQVGHGLRAASDAIRPTHRRQFERVALEQVLLALLNRTHLALGFFFLPPLFFLQVQEQVAEAGIHLLRGPVPATDYAPRAKCLRQSLLALPRVSDVLSHRFQATNIDSIFHRCSVLQRRNGLLLGLDLGQHRRNGLLLIVRDVLEAATPVRCIAGLWIELYLGGDAVVGGEGEATAGSQLND